VYNDPREIEQNQKLEALMKEEEKRFKLISRLLLLGPGESGKSTIFKQMKILYSNKEALESERKYKVNAVFTNIINNMRALVQAHAVLERDGLASPIENKSAAGDFQTLFGELANQDAAPKLDAKAAGIISALWKDPAIQKAYELRSRFQISDSTEYFFESENLKRICATPYLPNDMDILRTRIRTSGIIEHQYKVESAQFLVIDVGGQRTERGKWIYVFADVDAIVYVASLAGYDLKLYEDDKQNRMVEALQLFKEIVNLSLFPPGIAMILFLNKVDLFEEKIKKVDPSKLGIPQFASYTGGCDAEKAKKFFKDLFEKQADDRKVYTEFTCALDTKLMDRMMKIVKRIVVDQENNTGNPMQIEGRGASKTGGGGYEDDFDE